ncbi:cell division protein PerM [Timonella senegalensis]|uniref:cell division protein PerM n=1 Tax=Timonella senegalensis TaxID=1465825 RepID=UPI0002DD2E40|nr:DUF6350 family protein [Timonella senegalensis]
MGTTSYQPPRRGTQSRTSRVIEDRESLRKQLSGDDSIEGTHPAIIGALVALQSLLAGIVLIVLPVLVTSVVSTTLVDQNFNFAGTAHFGAAFWATAYGAHLTISGTTMTMVPLGLTLIVLLGSWFTVKRGLVPEWIPIASYVGTHVLAVVVLTAIVAPGLASLSRAFLGAAIVSVAAVYLGLRSAGGNNPVREALGRLPQWIRSSVKAGLGGLLLTVVLGALAVILWIILGRDSMANLLSGWSLDAMSGAALGIAQLSLIPNLIVWAISWLSGIGFAVGAGTIVAPAEVVLGPLPNIPVLAALPEAAIPVSFAVIFLCALVCAAGLPALAVVRGPYAMKWWQILVAPLLVAAVFTGVWALLAWWASGSFGPGRFAEMGVSVPDTALRMLLVCGAPAAVLIWLLRRETKAWVGSRFVGKGGPLYSVEDEEVATTSYSDETEASVPVGPLAAGSSAASARSSRSGFSGASPVNARSAESGTSAGSQPSSGSARSAHTPPPVD